MKKLALLALLIVSACGYSIRNIDNPTPHAPYEEWMAPGSIGGWELRKAMSECRRTNYASNLCGNVLEIMKAMLECGKPHYNPANDWGYKAMGYKTPAEQLNHQIMVTGCMEKAGFISQWDGLSGWCLHPSRKALPACQPDAVFPERSVERRLNSWHCKINTDIEYCRKYGNTPACDDPNEDYNNPPPECLP